jgi:long-chain fatty acid transport protein
MLCVVVVFSVLLAGNAFGSGFALIEQSARLQGYAYAGAAAVADDASTVYFNPAAMTLLDGRLVTTGLQIVTPQAEFTNQGSTHALQALTTVPLLGGNGGDSGQVGMVPALFYVESFDNGWSYGLGVNVPFGLTTEYDNGWVGRYHALKSEVKTININPSAAYRVNKNFSIGGGVSLQYIDAELSNAIDFGTLDAVDAFGLGAGALGLTPQADDGKVTLTGDDWSLGFNLGLLFECNSGNSRVGLSYRSRIEHDLEGDATFVVPPAVALLQAAGQFSNSSVAATVELPASASLSLFHRFNQKVAVMGDITWTEWSTLPELRFDFGNNMPDGVTTLNWDDSYRYSLGMMYNANEKLTLRTGAALDETPIPNAALRTPRIPGEQRIWLSAGAGYQITDRLVIDGAYSHLFVETPRIAKTLSGEDVLRGGLTGEYEASVDIVGIQVSYNF